MRCRERRWARPARKSTATRSAPRSPSAARRTRRPAWCLLARALDDLRDTLDHKFLNNIDALGPPTLENLTRFIWERVQHAGHVTRVSVHRDSCNESCTYFGPQD